jgi:hypothetical protein
VNFQPLFSSYLYISSWNNYKGVSRQ